MIARAVVRDELATNTYYCYVEGRRDIEVRSKAVCERLECNLKGRELTGFPLIEERDAAIRPIDRYVVRVRTVRVVYRLAE